MRRTPCGENGRVGWITQTELLNLQKYGQFPNEPAKIEDTQIRSVDSRDDYYSQRGIDVFCQWQPHLETKS